MAQGSKAGNGQSTQGDATRRDTGRKLSSIGERVQRATGGQLYIEKSDGFFGGSVAGIKPRFLYEWIAENHGELSVSLCCSVLRVRREGYYDFLKRPSREQSEKPLVAALRKIREEHPCYGTQSMIDELPDSLKPSYGKGYRVCRDNGLLTERRKPKSITKADPEAQKAEDLVQRDFYADTPGTKVFTDITEISCADGKLYFCGVLDAFDGAQIGYSMADHMRAEVCTAALMSAAVWTCTSLHRPLPLGTLTVACL